MEIILIAAIASNRVLGDSVTNDIPWRVSGEQLRFKHTTMGYPMIMGRKTYESIGRPLPGRESIIISRNPAYSVEGCTNVQSLDEALTACGNNSKVFIIGGGQIYQQTMDIADTIILTELTRPADGDILFPEIPLKEFTCSHIERVTEPEIYNITTYRRKSNKEIS